MQKPKIVLIEDEEDIAALIKLQAEISGYKLIVEVDGLNGFRAIEKEKPDLVILDIMLPGQSGLDVCRKIKTHPELEKNPCDHAVGKKRRARCRPRTRTRCRRLCQQTLFPKNPILARPCRPSTQ